MNLLALDTSSNACTVAVQIGGCVVSRHEQQARQHTKRLLPMIREVLAEAGTEPQQLDAIVLGNGPGSFIGMRIAASVAQGLAHAAGLRIIPVSSLAAVAAEVLADQPSQRVAVTQDAHMSEVYFGLYGQDDSGELRSLLPERLQGLSEIDEIASGVVPAGDGWCRYPELRALNAMHLDSDPEVLFPDARYLLPLARITDAIEPTELQPAYLRQKVAEKPGD